MFSLFCNLQILGSNLFIELHRVMKLGPEMCRGPDGEWAASLGFVRKKKHTLSLSPPTFSLCSAC